MNPIKALLASEQHLPSELGRVLYLCPLGYEISNNISTFPSKMFRGERGVIFTAGKLSLGSAYKLFNYAKINFV